MQVRKIVRNIAFLAALAFAAAWSGSEVHAGWGHRSHGSSGGSWGSSGGSWGSSGGSWGSRGYASSGGSWGRHHHIGPFRRLAMHIRAHHSHGSRGNYSSGGSHGSWGSRGYASFGSSGGYSSGGRYRYYSSSGGSSGGRAYYTYPQNIMVQPGQPAPIPANTQPNLDPNAPQPGPENNGASSGGTNFTRLKKDAVLNLRIPEESVVFVNGKRTRTPGIFRSYVSKNLIVGKTYTYEVRVELDQEGEKLTRTKVIELKAGANKTFDIDFDVSPELVTSLTLYVPEDAKVKLGGMETSASGELRYFSTKSLTKGEAWKDYTVAVTVNRNGRNVTKDRVITVNAGESKDLRFDFEGENSVASR